MVDNKELTNLFATEDQRKVAVANFKALKAQAGWQLLVEIVEGNIRVLEDQILNGFEDETPETINRKRDKLKAYKEVITTPDYWVDKFEDGQQFKEDVDPYHTIETLAETRKRR